MTRFPGSGVSTRSDENCNQFLGSPPPPLAGNGAPFSQRQDVEHAPQAFACTFSCILSPPFFLYSFLPLRNDIGPVVIYRAVPVPASSMYPEVNVPPSRVFSDELANLQVPSSQTSNVILHPRLSVFHSGPYYSGQGRALHYILLTALFLPGSLLSSFLVAGIPSLFFALTSPSSRKSVVATGFVYRLSFTPFPPFFMAICSCLPPPPNGQIPIRDYAPFSFLPALFPPNRSTPSPSW